MKKILAIAFAAMMSLGTMAQTAQQVLDKTAAVIGNKKGATANFKLSSPKYGSASGTITIKGNKFNARTPEAIVWYNGKTQWTYMKKTNEVNVSNPTQAKQMSMNPYTFIHIYKTGYKSSLKTVGSNYQVHLVADNQKRTVAEMYIHQQEHPRAIAGKDAPGFYLEHHQHLRLQGKRHFQQFLRLQQQGIPRSRSHRPEIMSKLLPLQGESFIKNIFKTKLK